MGFLRAARGWNPRPRQTGGKIERRGLEVFLEFQVLGVRIVFESLVGLVVTRSATPTIALLLLFFLAAEQVLAEANLSVVASRGSKLRGL